ncbi:preprotein translocase subunit SecE [Sinomicrobium sp.]
MTIISYIKESFGELKNNVTWTSWPEAQRLMVVVAVFSILFSLAIWGVDLSLGELISLYYNSLS